MRRAALSCAVAFAGVLAAAPAALAQTTPTGPLGGIEQQIIENNRSMSRQQQQRGQEQQFRFEIDQLRQQQLRQQQFPPPAGVTSPTCPRGAIGC